MSSVDINYKDSKIASLDESGIKTLLTEGKYCEDDIEVVYTKPTPSLQTKSVSYTPTESTQSETVTADSGYDGLAGVDVSVDAVSSTYVGSDISRRSSTDVAVSSTGVISVPIGYYSSNVSKSIIRGSVASASSITASGATISANATDNTLTLSKQDVGNTSRLVQAGYVTSGTASATDLSLIASVNVVAAGVYYASSTDRVIPANTYFSGARTIKGITTTNLTTGNIKAGVTVYVGDTSSPTSIKSITGTYSGSSGGIYKSASKSVTLSAKAEELIFTDLIAQPSEFFVRLTGTSTFAKPSSTSHYYVVGCGKTISDTGTVLKYANYILVSNTALSERTNTGYPVISWADSTNTLTLRGTSYTASPGAFYPGTWVLHYFYIPE